ncbi:MAG: LacI family DNA-binding transcriptional regulator [Chloroflexi bacterium]|nr:MAG: LacI family DNA-binding transcriptional regulator [Chloroflexota bacterium]
MTPDTSSPKTITLNQVAADAGVSRSTVSLVLRNSPLVADDTRAQVQASIKRLGYVYNRGAASLRSQHSNTIGLIVTDITNPFFAELTVGVEGGLEESRYTALLGNTSDTIQKQSLLLERMQEHWPDGILLCPTDGTSLAQVRRLQRQTALVLFVRYLPDLEIDYVGADNVRGAEQATAHLLAHGHRRIAFAGGPATSSAWRDRVQGFTAQMQQAGLAVDESLLAVGSVTREGGRSAILELLGRENPPTAALCYNDVVAFGVMLGLQAAGRTPGKDFGVIGFDDITEAELWRPTLTTVALQPRHLGEVAT